ncbi:2-hydroxymuconate semialdehyde hydrolase [bacterium HR39]|nr:2-hydroxymuconate semialdehyde hydrolase [bacterium HR39]
MLAPDLAGFGASTHPATPPRHIRGWMRLWTDQCLALLDALGLARAHLVGTSLGGCIALHLLAEAPERFGRVALLAPAGAPLRITPELDRLWGFYEDPTPAVMARLVRRIVPAPAVLGEDVDSIARLRTEAALRPEVRRSDEAMFGGDRQAVADAPVVPEAALVRMPHEVLVVHGREDRILPYPCGLWLAERPPLARLFLLPRCGHRPHVEHWAAVQRLLSQHLAGDVRELPAPPTDRRSPV